MAGIDHIEDPYFFVIPHGNPPTSWDILDTRTQTVVNTINTRWEDAVADQVARNLAARGG